MKKLLFAVTLLPLCFGAGAKGRPQSQPQPPLHSPNPTSVEVRYEGEGSLDKALRNLLFFDNTSYCVVLFNPEVADKVFTIKEVVCREGVFTESEMIPDDFTVRGVSRITFIARPTEQGKVRINFATDAASSRAKEIELGSPDHSRILMETYDAAAGEVFEIVGEDGSSARAIRYPSGAEFPVIAYTTGIRSEGAGFYCGLRDAHVHPREWFGKFGIDNYLYYTVQFK